MKKIISGLIVFLIVLSMSAAISADAGDCICGREYITESADSNELYKCMKCKKNFLLCTCDCFCGHKAVSDTGEDGSPIKICSGCGKNTLECTCADRQTALKLEAGERSGEISHKGIRIPQLPTEIILISLIAVTAAFIWITDKKLLKKKSEITDREEEPFAKSLKERGFGTYRILNSLYKETAPDFPSELSADDPDAVRLSAKDVEMFKKALIGEETDISYFLNIISNKLLDSSLFPTEKGLHTAKILYEKTEDYRVGFGPYETVRIFKSGDRFDIRLEQKDKVSLYLSLTASEAATLIRKSVGHRPKRDFEPEKTNITIEKDEWTAFIYILYTGLNSFTFDGLLTKDTVSGFMKKTRPQQCKEFRRKAEIILKNKQRFEKAIEGLFKKGFFTENEDGEFEIKENIRKDFAPDKFVNIVYFEELEDGAETIHINFVLNRTGGVAVLEKDDKIKLLSSFSIPWSHYIR